MKIGQKIKGMRVEKGITTITMAEKLGVSEPTYRRYETDKSFPDINMIDKISKILGKSFLDVLPIECFAQNNNNLKEGAVVNLGAINNLSEKLIEQFEKLLLEKEKRINDKDELIKELRALIAQKK